MAYVPFPLNTLMYIVKLPLVLISLWIIYILIDNAWSGLSNIINIFLFPGYVLRITTQSFIAKLLGISPRVYALQGRGRPGAKMYIQLKDPLMATILAVSPALTALPFYIMSVFLFDMSNDIYAKLVAGWLAISVFITGFPNFSDLGFIVASIIAHNPLLQILLLWSTVILIISLNLFDILTSTAIVLSYIFLVILVNVSIKKKREIPIIINED